MKSLSDHFLLGIPLEVWEAAESLLDGPGDSLSLGSYPDPKPDPVCTDMARSGAEFIDKMILDVLKSED